jgi:hypothetical protein
MLYREIIAVCFQIQLSNLVYCLSQPLANNTCFAHSSSKPRFSHRDSHGILRADTTRSVCRILQTISYCLKDTGEPGFTSWQGIDSVSWPRPPNRPWTSLSFLPNTYKIAFLGVRQTGIEALHTSSSMEIPYFRTDHILLSDLLKHLKIIPKNMPDSLVL